MAARIINMTIPEELLRKVDEAAKAEGRTRSELFREAVRRRYLEERRAGRKDGSRLLSRLRALAVEGPDIAAADIDRLLYPPARRP